MLSPFIVHDKNLFLDRYPPRQVNRSLQAWDATDEYLLQHFTEQHPESDPLNILIFNDTFGALSCCLTKHNITVVTDSYLAEQGIIHNLEQNHLEENKVNVLSSIAPLPESVDVILYRIPKSKSLMVEQLSRIQQTYSKNSATYFVAGAKAKDIHSSTLKTFEQIIGEVKTSLAVKKSRLVLGSLNQGIKAPTINASHVNKSWPLENTSFTIANLANVFAREKLDIGARLFLQHMPSLSPNQHVIDLGCGNGVLGLVALSEQPELSVTFCDESFMAVESARLNVENNLPDHYQQASFNVGDCLSNIPPNAADIILCNPPFHQQHATTDHIAWQMFNESFDRLKKGGELRIVGNRQLGYHVKLKRIFGNCTTIASDKKFVILSAKKL